jgi:2-hydroxycyclohexanecarboxyl-CoA dehydrogenase
VISTQDGGMSDQCALIVGGTSGIGLASAVALAKDGVNGIRVNALTPSLVTGTGTSDRIFAHEFSTKIFDKISAKVSLGVPTADDLAALVTFLAGPASAKITGQAISINGGISAG